MARPRHANKDIEAALKYAEQLGWTVIKRRGHAWGIMRCGAGHDGCSMSIYSTPKHPEWHARLIRRTVDSCPGANP